MQGKEIAFYFEREFGRRIGGWTSRPPKGDAQIECACKEHSSEEHSSKEHSSEEHEGCTSEEHDGCTSEESTSEEYEEQIQREYKDSNRSNLLMLFYGIIIFFWMATLVTSCTTVKYVPVPIETETHVHDSTNIRDSIVQREVINQRDSIIYRDSVVQVVDENGNIIKEKYYQYKEVNRHLEKQVQELKEQLALEMQKKAEVREVPVYIEKELTRWQKFKLQAGEVLIVAIGLFCLYFVLKIVKYFHFR